MRSDIDTALEEIRVTQNRDPTAAEVLDAEARAARLLPQRATQPAHTGIPISEFLAGRGERRRRRRRRRPTPASPYRSSSRSRRRAHHDDAGRRPAPRPRSHGAWRPWPVGGATAARPHGGIHISEFLRRHEGPAGVASARACRRTPWRLGMFQKPDDRGRGPARRAHRRNVQRGRRRRIWDGRWVVDGDRPMACMIPSTAMLEVEVPAWAREMAVARGPRSSRPALRDYGSVSSTE